MLEGNVEGHVKSIELVLKRLVCLNIFVDVVCKVTTFPSCSPKPTTCAYINLPPHYHA